MRMFTVLTMALSFLALSCDDTGVCDPNASRCQGDSVQICDSDGRWVTTMTCNEVGEEFTCQQDTDGLHTCLPGELDPPDTTETPDITEGDTEGDTEEVIEPEDTTEKPEIKDAEDETTD